MYSYLYMNIEDTVMLPWYLVAMVPGFKTSVMTESNFERYCNSCIKLTGLTHYLSQ